MSNFVNLMDIIYPVGSIYQSMSATSPASTIGGTWTQLKTFLYGSTTAKQTGGEATHTLTTNEMPRHAHTIHVNIQHSDGQIVSTLESLTSGLQVGGRRRYFDTTDTDGGGQHTTTCRPIQPALSGIAPLKAKRGGVCLTTLTSWILSTQLGQYLFQTIQSRQQAHSVEHGQSSIATPSFAMARPAPLAGLTLKNYLLLICRQMFGSQVEPVSNLDCLQVLVFYLIRAVPMVLMHRVLPLIKMTNTLTNHLITDLNTGLSTFISAQPSYMLGGVA